MAGTETKGEAMMIDLSSVLVDDQRVALRFYTEVLGFVKKTEVPMGEHAWLTVVSPEDPDGTELVLEPSDHPAVVPFKKRSSRTGSRTRRSPSRTCRRNTTDLSLPGSDSSRHRRAWAPSRQPCSMTHAAT